MQAKMKWYMDHMKAVSCSSRWPRMSIASLKVYFFACCDEVLGWNSVIFAWETRPLRICKERAWISIKEGSEALLTWGEDQTKKSELEKPDVMLRFFKLRSVLFVPCVRLAASVFILVIQCYPAVFIFLLCSFTRAPICGRTQEALNLRAGWNGSSGKKWHSGCLCVLPDG